MKRASPVSDSNIFYAKALNSLGALRNTCLAFGISGLTFSTWWHTIPTAIAAIPAEQKTVIVTLLSRAGGLGLGVIAVTAGCAGCHQLFRAFRPSEKNPLSYGHNLSQGTVQERTKILGLSILSMQTLWYFTDSVPLRFKSAVHALFLVSQVCNLAAYEISRAKGNLQLPQPK